MSQAFRDELWLAFCGNEHVHIRVDQIVVLRTITGKEISYGRKAEVLDYIDDICQEIPQNNFLQNTSYALGAVITIYFADSSKVYVCDEVHREQDKRILYLFFRQYIGEDGKIAYKWIEESNRFLGEV